MVSTLTRRVSRWLAGCPRRTARSSSRSTPRSRCAVIGALRLEAFLFTETEIWPTCLEELTTAAVPAFMVSGRVSERTLRRARWLRPLYRPALATVTCCMQTDDDARRIVLLGADPRRVSVAGSLKYDGAAVDPPADVQRLRDALGPGRRMLVAGSTHDGEEAMLLEAFRRVRPGHPELVLLLAPRHPDRFAAVAALVEAAGVPLVRYQSLVAGEAPATVPPRRRSRRRRAARALLCARCGGLRRRHLVPVGGHNVLEPARAARPVLVGPHTTNAADAVERLVTGGGALRVSTTDSLAWALAGLLDEPARAADMGRRRARSSRAGRRRRAPPEDHRGPAHERPLRAAADG